MSLLVVGVALLWLIVGVACWLCYQLLRQNGRILLRLEALEVRLTQLVGEAEEAGLSVGELAPYFELPDLSGRHRALSEFSGRRVLLVFFSPACTFCVNMTPGLAALPADGTDGHAVPVVVTTGGLEENRRLVATHGIRCLVLIQASNEVADQFRVDGSPMGYVIDEHGLIASERAVGAEAVLALASDRRGTAEPRETQSEGRQWIHRGDQVSKVSRIHRSGLPAGTPAPGFRLSRLEGGEIALEDYRGRPFLLVFSDPECGPCDELAPKLEERYRQLPHVEVLMVTRREAELNRGKVRQFGLTFPVVLQRQWEISQLYGMFATPIGYLIDERGVIAADVAVGVEPILSLLSQAAVLQRREVGRTVA